MQIYIVPSRVSSGRIYLVHFYKRCNEDGTLAVNTKVAHLHIPAPPVWTSELLVEHPKRLAQTMIDLDQLRGKPFTLVCDLKSGRVDSAQVQKVGGCS